MSKLMPWLLPTQTTAVQFHYWPTGVDLTHLCSHTICRKSIWNWIHLKLIHPDSAPPICCVCLLLLCRCELGFIHAGFDLQPGLDSLPEPHWSRGPCEEFQVRSATPDLGGVTLVWMDVTIIMQMHLKKLWMWRCASFTGLSVWF